MTQNLHYAFGYPVKSPVVTVIQFQP